MSPLSVTRAPLWAIAAVFVLFAPIATSTNVFGDVRPERAVYQGLEDDRHLTEWLVLGPVPVSSTRVTDVDDESQRVAFEKLHLDWAALDEAREAASVSVEGRELKWRYVASDAPIIDLDAIFNGADMVAAYALAYIEVSEPRTTLLGVGSDDGVRIWLNGELVHHNWIPRPVTEDDDVVTLKLKEGVNTLLIKVQDMRMGWGFVARPLGAAARSTKLVDAAAGGNLDDVRALLDGGANVNAIVAPGWTALQAARINGREGIVEELIARGAEADVAMPAPHEFFQNRFANLTEEVTPGVAMLISRGGNILYQGSFGYADRERRMPVTTETKFRIGSVTKQFTAAAILKLREEGKVNLGDPLSKYLPGFPRGEEVTIYQLLTHTSGIRSYTSRPQFESWVLAGIASAALVDSIRSYGFDFDPGASQSYNNSGYFLLGHIVETVSGMPFDEYLKATFFEPLGMKDTGIHYRGIALENEALGYSYLNNEFRRALDWDMSWAGGAGAMYSTLGDLNRWNEALFSGRVLTDESLEIAFTPSRLNDGSVGNGIGAPYGFGWIIRQYRGQREIGHSGGLHGFASHLIRLPDKDLTVAVLANALPSADVNPQAIAQDLAAAYLWEELGPQETFSTQGDVDEEKLEAFVGRYSYPGGAVLVVSRVGARLFAQLTGQPNFEIFPRGDGEFFWKVVDAQISFVRTDDGRVSHGIHRQGGAEIEVPKLVDEQYSIDAEKLDDYLGRYEYPGGVVMTVTREDDRLFAQLTGQPVFEVFPKAEDVFFWKVVDAQIEFIRGEEGRIVRGVHRQGGAEFEVPKIP